MTKRSGKRIEVYESGQGSHEAFSLWTAPPGSWESPIERVPEPADLKVLLAALDLDRSRVEGDEQAQAFKTPVTPDVLSQPTQG